MPGAVSDSYDPEWGTSSVKEEIDAALGEMYDVLSRILQYEPPIDIRELATSTTLRRCFQEKLTERQWRLLRFAVERARESL